MERQAIVIGCVKALYLSLQSALSKEPNEPQSKALFTVKKPFLSDPGAIWCDNSNSFLFDPHSRNESEMATADVYAILTGNTHLKAICLYIQHH